MVDGADSTAARRLRSAAPALDGPLASSGAAPEPGASKPAAQQPGAAKPVDSKPAVPTQRTPGPAASDAPGDPKAADDKPTDARQVGVDADETGAKRADDTPVEVKTTGAEKTDAEKTDAASDDAAATTSDTSASDGPTRVGSPRRTRVPFAHALRRVPPARQVPAATARAVGRWARGGSGRLVLPALFILALVAAAGLAGGVLIPATAHTPPSRAGGASGSQTDPGAPAPGQPSGPAPTAGAGLPTSGLPGTALPGTGLPGGVLPPSARPADVLTGWAAQTSARTGVAPLAMQAYGYAELVLAQTTPACKLSWTTLAAIGFIESGHGTANRNTVDAKGASTPGIIGLPLDGTENRMRIMDTDRGVLDGDVTYDRAVGPMQFIPTTWQESGVDADNDGVKNPQDIDDAALAAGNYLCKGNRNLSVAEDWWNAILSYNDVRVYAQDVFNKANEYGANSRA
ncbi:membrane-bound lytic murein transglycosylase B [Micromonospora pisi]|uniref:Membrane-bound lytic murein transglycosylase B n=1 Tax=Micromonospora pisi TaxID=589240 RepID=A0A495JIK9_9ACTN|nr:lytic murein transglycosylase [Micromonospora pisi]RKR88757.1 membrane-bound lytic murein transglycosylase B [Micromonospora pisi]